MPVSVSPRVWLHTASTRAPFALSRISPHAEASPSSPPLQAIGQQPRNDDVVVTCSSALVNAVITYQNHFDIIIHVCVFKMLYIFKAAIIANQAI